MSQNFTYTLWGQQRLISHIVKRGTHYTTHLKKSVIYPLRYSNQMPISQHSYN